jgi:hypothetical protein
MELKRKRRAFFVLFMIAVFLELHANSLPNFYFMLVEIFPRLATKNQHVTYTSNPDTTHKTNL